MGKTASSSSVFFQAQPSFVVKKKQMLDIIIHIGATDAKVIERGAIEEKNSWENSLFSLC